MDVNVNLLQAIADSPQGFIYLSAAEGSHLVQHDPSLIDVNINVTDPSDSNKVAARLSNAGREYLNHISSKEKNNMNYQIIKGAIPPASKRGNSKGGGAPVQYPFDDLDVGESFFVPVSDKHTNPVKTLGSTVSSANNRYAEETGEMVSKERTKRGSGNRAVLDDEGNKVRETVEVPVKKFTRRFGLRGVEKGKTYGSFTADEDGALITRLK